MNGSTDDGAMPNEDAAPEIPDFELLCEIGRGGFGRVWLARNRTTGQRRAVKVIPRSRARTSNPAGREIVSLTRMEANLRRRHPSLLTIHHVGQTAEHLFYVMDLADDAAGNEAASPACYQAATLERRLADGPLEAEACLACVRQLLAGLASLHAAGMVHRDVKPANCLFVDGELKLADFGLLTEAGSHVSRVGTEKYMPPDGRMDARADVYAAGLVVYEMLTGFPADRFPWLGPTADSLAANPPLAALMRLALTASQPAPDARFRDGGAMLAALEGSLIQSPPSPSTRRWIAAALAVVVLGGTIGAGVWWMTPGRVDVNFVTYPFDATILLDNRPLSAPEGTPAQTPCTVEHLPARTYHVVFQHPQRPDLDMGEVDFAKTHQVVGRWDATDEERIATPDERSGDR
jgi:serine/threonine protein kinase